MDDGKKVVMKRALRILHAGASESAQKAILQVFKKNGSFKKETIKQVSDIVGAGTVRAAFRKANDEYLSQRADPVTTSSAPVPASAPAAAGASSESAMRTASAAHAQNNECFAAEIDASVRDTLDFGRRVNALREQLSEGDNNDSLKHTLFLRQTALR